MTVSKNLLLSWGTPPVLCFNPYFVLPLLQDKKSHLKVPVKKSLGFGAPVCYLSGFRRGF